jgi:lactoylglutathione lyase
MTFAFCTPRATRSFPIAGEGVLIELVQAPPEVIAALG